LGLGNLLSRILETMKTKPYAHQLEELLRTRSLPVHALFWDQGTGKTKVIIDTAEYLYQEGKISGMVVVSLSSIEANWVYDEIPDHLADSVPRHMHVWSSKKRKTKVHQRAVEALFDYTDGLAVLAISWNAVMTDDGALALKKFLGSRPCLYIVDESVFMKTPNARVTKRMLASAKHAPYRRLLNGTPVEDSPLDSYSQVKFIDPNIWTQHGINTFGQFKTFFAVWEQRRLKDNRTFPALVSYRNLDILKACLKEAGTRVMKEDVLDLPPKVFTKAHFDLNPAQRKLYDELKSEMVAQIEPGVEITTELAIVQMTRFQQICSGYVPADDETELRQIGDNNPRLECLGSVLQTVPDKESIIIFAKYNIDVDEISALLSQKRISHYTFDGRTPEDDRTRFKHGFQDGERRVFVAKPLRGLTLHRASTVIFYNNGFSADKRRQAEDRAHRIGQTKTVRYIDIVARNTVDEHIISVLRRKKATSSLCTGDQLRAWI
jgi:uncharacterized DUF497 family protein